MSTWQGSFGECGFASGMPGIGSTPGGFVRYWEVGEYAELLQQVESFLDSVLETGQIPFGIRHQSGHLHAVRNPVGVSGYRNLTGFLPLCGQWMDLYWPQYSYRADLQLFFDCFMQHPFSQVSGYATPVGIVDKAHAAYLYNDFVGRLRTEAVRRGVKKTLADARGNLRDQADSIGRYLGDLVNQHKSLVPVRVDFYYQQDAFDASDAMLRGGWAMTKEGIWMAVPSSLPMNAGRPETRARIDTAAAMAHRDSFFGNRRGADSHLFDRMVGHVCKLEQGGERGANHFHCVFLIDAKGMTQGDVYTLKCGLKDRWRRVTRGQGLLFDCHESDYRHGLEARGQWAIDPLDCSNPIQVATFINYVAWYFAKDGNQTVRIKPTARARALTMGR